MREEQSVYVKYQPSEHSANPSLEVRFIQDAPRCGGGAFYDMKPQDGHFKPLPV